MNDEDPSSGNSSYSAELLLHLMDKGDLKLPCQEGWPHFIRMCHKRFVPAEAWQYVLLKCTDGVEETRPYPLEYTWQSLCEEAAVESCAYLPEQLAAKPHLLLLWLIVAPHGSTSDVGRVLWAKLIQ
jgi:hypothetical protein